MSYNKSAWVEVIKKELKARAISQRQAARELKISLPTLKRWLAGNGLTLENFDRLLDYMDITLADLANMLPQHAMTFEYTIQQEEYLAKNPKIFAVFDRLLLGKTPKKIVAESNVSMSEMHKILSRLDKLRLIDWLPKDKVLLKVKGEPKWRHNGPLSIAFRQSILNQLLHKSAHKDMFLATYDLSSSDKSLFEEKISQLKQFLNQAEARARKQSTTSPLTLGIFSIDEKPSIFNL